MKQSQTNNKQIAKNAIALYIRMLATLIIGLFTSRVILNTLGVEDFGIYNVIGGFVSMFSLVGGTLQGAVSRFLTFELGTGNSQKLKTVFSTSVLVMIGLSVIILLLTETFGIWYLYNKMVIPTERLDVAFWVFQLSLVSFVLSMLNTPYSASIISHEKMGIYAYMTILDSTSKLLVCYLLLVSPFDKLLFYSILLCTVGIINQSIYFVYCKRNFEECTFHWEFNSSLFKKMFSFAGWDFIGSSAAILRNHGSNLMLNAFGGPIVNAAYGISNTITGVVYNFVSNFTAAFKPQIVKRYANEEYESLMTLLIFSSKYSFYIMLFMGLPVMLNVHFLLELWLGQVPKHADTFAVWTLVFLMAESMSRPIVTAKDATGNIRNYQLVVGGVLLLVLPVSYILLRLGAPVEAVVAINALDAILAIFARMYMLRGDFPSWSSGLFFREVVLNALKVSVVGATLPVILYLFIADEGWVRLLSTSIISTLCVILSVLYVGCNTDEREKIITSVTNYLSKLKHK